MPDQPVLPTITAETVALRINGLDWQGWTSVQITRSVDQIAGGFALALSDRWSYADAALPLAAGMSCQLLSTYQGAETPLIDGYLDKVSPTLSASEHGISVEGRDKSADMVDCAAIHTPGQWTKTTVAELATILASPFTVGVTMQGTPGAPFPSFKLEPGETAFDALKRAMQQRELLAMPDGKGNIVLSLVGQQTASTTLVQGENVLAASSTFDGTERFSEYIVQGQKQGTDAVFGASAAAVKGKVKDEAVTRYRPMLLRAEQQGDAGHMRQRAAWEKTIRAARSVSVSVTVQGWRTGNGELWPVGQLVVCKLPYLYIDQSLLIASATYTKNLQGTLCTLTLKDPDAYKPEPTTPKSAGSGSGSGGGASDLFLKARLKAEAEQKKAGS